MKPKNAGKNMWLRAQTAKQKLKQNAQIQDGDGVQAFFCVINDSVRGEISPTVLLVGGGASSHQPPTFLLRLLQRNMQHFKTKTV